MPSVIQVAQNLVNKYLNSAPKANREKIKRVIQIYRNNKKSPETPPMTWSWPSICPRRLGT